MFRKSRKQRQIQTVIFDPLFLLPHEEFDKATEAHARSHAKEIAEDVRCNRFSAESEIGKHFESVEAHTATPQDKLLPARAEGCVNVEFMYQMLFVLESNIVRTVLSRMQPRFAKSVKETSKGRLHVGCLTMAQWEYWKPRLCCPNPPVRSLVKMPLLFHTKRTKAFREVLSWKMSDPLPNFLGNASWWCSKWQHRDILYRAWVKTLGICWNSQNETVTIHLSYELQHLIKYDSFSYWENY